MCRKISSLAGSEYDPDSKVTYTSITRLEAAGLKVVTSLQSICYEFARALDIDTFILENVEPSLKFDVVLCFWLCSSHGSHPPTWRSLYSVLRELNLEDLAEGIEDYLQVCGKCVVA